MKITIDENIVTEVTGQIDQEYISQFFSQIFQKTIDLGLNISSLKEINFVYDYTGELSTFQRNNGLYEGHSENGFAKVEHIFNGNDLEHYIFCHYAFLVSLIVDEEVHPEVIAGKKLSYNSFLHELCHVHDDNELFSKFGFLTFRLNNHLDNVLYTIAMSLWNEYFAHRVSMSSLPIDIELDSNRSSLLSKEEKLNIIPQSEKVIIYQNVHRYIDYVVRQIGNFHGGNLDERELYDSFEGTIIYNHIDFISSKLQLLFDTYPNWIDYTVFDDLVDAIILVWNDLGFEISRLNNDFFLIKR